ncbi:uncharacterized protein BT62DRAFT_927665 [Guyanagaster necrorhizus]|uniref:GYF domain-containing protein n=1 Tax=Guyanagaster necrorhizus TaxID=856835 RepID=A0A9P7W2X9_9AGAR|nr:uncharacterized protein BT62DRAFT_927665 [Guyanagaster necrorhizus MCA 3950]KAG7450356.1 hypothetical protein BT62DRAFT_927665 [Guyanagaster necrorhizus MCA 3950]
MSQVEDDQYSDAPDTFEDERYDDLPRGIEEVEVRNVESPHKAITDVITAEEDKEETRPLLESSHGASLSTTGEVEQTSDAASAHSVPAVQVTHRPDPLETQRRLQTASPSARSARPPPPSPARSSHSVRPSTASDDRRVRRRSITEVRASNRLSDFFNNLMHRRDPVAHTDDTLCEERRSTVHGKKNDTSRPPTPPGRSTTPPPDLPPPSLQELGLSLSVLTSDLSPSHFSTPPASGAFLSPHYLLLCHAQGLDVLPLISPPAPQPYALVRRVSFKSVVVMEQRGVLVAIAGRRDGVRVYALEEVKRAVEWRIEVELRRERERQRRETSKKFPSGVRDAAEPRDSTENLRRPFSSTSPPGDSHSAKVSNGHLTSSPAVPLIPRTPTTHRRQKTRMPSVPPSGHPPPYTSPSPERLASQVANLSPPRSRSRGASVSDVLTAGSIRRNTNATVRPEGPDAKADWVESSDDEAISLVAAGSSGSQALDERTSAAAQTSSTIPVHTTPRHPRPMSMSRSNRPANLDLTISRSNTVVPPEPSPAPTLLTLQQALSHSPSREPHARLPSTPLGDDDDDDADGISLSQVLQESRIPDLPPPGSRQPQQPILISSSHPVSAGDDEPSSPRTSDAHSSVSVRSFNDRSLPGRRRRWSVIINQSSESNLVNEQQPSTAPPMRERLPNLLTRSTSFRSSRSTSGMRPSSSPNDALSLPSPNPPPPMPDSAPSVISSHSSRTSRFIPRIFSSAFHHRRTDERPSSPSGIPDESSKRTLGAPLVAQSPPPKLEYVKLPGTKGALLVKAVETAKKSFLAILCGDNGERVELFAGTYRTALGLSRTFILPDSPRSLELQLQGDDLVEVFLVFSQNVFGLEPATVRVREVRIGRAERRAARRRAREVRATDAGANESEPHVGEEDTNVNVSIGVSVAVGSTVVATGSGPDGQQTPPLISSQHPMHPIDRRTASESATERPSTPPETTTTSTVAHPEEIVALATAQMGPYTTFQQLSFAPKFPLASIADEYVIPPTYPEFIDYRNEHEPEMGSGSDLSQVQFSPPGLPIPTPSAPSKWYYRDPKNIIHGPWKASLMQAWYKDGLLPPDLPVRREEDSDFMLLKDLRLQSVDPTHPFRTVSPQVQDISPPPLFQPSDKPLLKPISLLSQPRHFGPPALFFSSRGGHSTTIVDNRGRSVLKGRFVWSKDAQEDSKHATPFRMGDVKRLEAFDVKDRSVLVAMRQGGLEAVDLSDALLKPGDESRTALPQYNPSSSNFNRRGPFVWKIGTPISGSSSSAVLPSKPKISHYSHYTSGKKTSSGPSKSPAGRTEFNVGHIESEMNDEVLFLGRKDDEIYICERNAGSFRILRLCPNV